MYIPIYVISCVQTYEISTNKQFKYIYIYYMNDNIIDIQNRLIYTLVVITSFSFLIKKSNCYKTNDITHMEFFKTITSYHLIPLYAYIYIYIYIADIKI